MKVVVGCLVFVAGVAVGARAGQAPRLFAVELTRGPAWDTARPANEQPGFAGHSANIKRAHFAPDPMVEKDVFRADVAALSTFKHGCTDAKR
jgi:hypothetical protein